MLQAGLAPNKLSPLLKWAPDASGPSQSRVVKAQAKLSVSSRVRRRLGPPGPLITPRARRFDYARSRVARRLCASAAPPQAAARMAGAAPPQAGITPPPPPAPAASAGLSHLAKPCVWLSCHLGALRRPWRQRAAPSSSAVRALMAP